MDLDTDCENVNVAVALPGGIDLETVEVCLSADGKTAKLSYDWPKDLYVMKELYFEEIEADERVDSTILSMSETLRTQRPKTDIAPRALIVIPLPMSVQTDSKTWSSPEKSVAMDSGTQSLPCVNTLTLLHYCCSKYCSVPSSDT